MDRKIQSVARTKTTLRFELRLKTINNAVSHQLRCVYLSEDLVELKEETIHSKSYLKNY